MTRWPTSVRRVLGAGRAPRVARTRAATVPAVPRLAVVGPEASLVEWLPTAVSAAPGPAALVIDPRRSSRPARALVDAVAATLYANCFIAEQRGPWVRLAGLEGGTLQSVDVPAAVADASTVALLSAPSGSEGVARLWLGVVHPNTALRARALPRDGAVELAAWLPATWVIRIAAGPDALVAVTRNPVMAELIALGIARLTERSANIEAITPWEEAGVQRLFELQIDTPDSGTTLRATDAATAQLDLLRELAETINATITTIQGG